MTKCPNISKSSKTTGHPGMFVDLFHYILTNLKIIWVTCGLKMTKYLTEYFPQNTMQSNEILEKIFDWNKLRLNKHLSLIWDKKFKLIDKYKLSIFIS